VKEAHPAVPGVLIYRLYTGSALVFPDRFEVYYGMAENRTGLAHLDLPEP
jgi:hypothetical protein